MADQRTRKARTVAGLAVVLMGMTVLVYYAVPLYQYFCRVTGYGGTTNRTAAAPAKVGTRIVIVRFNADVASGLPWAFHPVKRQITVRVGERRLAYFAARNTSRKTIVGTATFNVTPQKAGLYFSKIECFCFTEQRLAPGQAVRMPVSFFIDPAIAKDRNLDDVRTITLSYTMYRKSGSAARPARGGRPTRLASGRAASD